jgi:Ca2+-binding RTX toxin-like protein
MAKFLKRLLDGDPFAAKDAGVDAYIWTKPPDGPYGGPIVPGPGDLLGPGPLPPLFTPSPDNVNFNNLKANQYDPASYYSALRGDDTVVLPADQAKADAIGYDPTQIFDGAAGNDFIVGGALNDLISGGDANDRLFSNSGDDILAGGNGNDQLFAAAGNDILYAGMGIDYLDAGAGNDILVSLEDDQGANEDVDNAPSPFPFQDPFGLSRDNLYGGAGNDLILATNDDNVNGGSGNDLIALQAESTDFPFGIVSGGTGDDIILGSKSDDWLFTGTDFAFWPMAMWNAANKAAYGGFTDIVASGDGDDHVNTMIYCNANVDTGAGNDDVFVLGLYDLISMGDGFDELYLFGGACKADLGDGIDYLSIGRAAYDNPNVSEITLGAGADMVHFTTNEWLTNGDQQPQSKAPWILDFDVDEDEITQIDVTNLDDATQSLDADNIKVIDIKGGSALIYDDPVDNSVDFCFARFNGVSAEALQANIDANTIFA